MAECRGPQCGKDGPLCCGNHVDFKGTKQGCPSEWVEEKNKPGVYKRRKKEVSAQGGEASYALVEKAVGVVLGEDENDDSTFEVAVSRLRATL